LPLNNFVLKPEVVDAYELGAKSEFAQRRVRLDGAFFWNKISNPQVSGVKNGLIYLQNAGSAETRGFDFDAMARVTDSLGLRMSGTYLEATFTNFSNAATYCPSPQVSAAECQLLSPVPPLAPGNLNPYTINASGHEMPYASRWKLLTSADYAWNLGHAGSLAFDLTGNYQSSYFWDADNVIQEPAHFFLDGSIAYTPDVLSSRSILRFWMKNITGVHYNVNYVAQASGSAYSSAPGAPRTFGANVTYHF
jgi:iron complex outermembrane receptor protein